MGENSKIEWTDHTFNPWVGCQKVSPACTNCYAESWAKRTGQPGLWRGERRRTSAANWRKPIRWNTETPGARVFCSSLADVFEDRTELDPWRDELFDLIGQTPRLTWLLLTKRPDHARNYPGITELSNVWVGCTVEDQQRADERIPHLLQIPARVRFLSMEPLLGPVDLSRVVYDGVTAIDALRGLHGWPIAHAPFEAGSRPVNWVIAGGESGPRARPSNPEWFRSIRNQCAEAGVPFHFKQWGEWAPGSWTTPARSQGSQVMAIDGRHKSLTEAFDPVFGDALVLRVGKAAAGRLLDGRTHDGLPVAGGSDAR